MAFPASASETKQENIKGFIHSHREHFSSSESMYFSCSIRVVAASPLAVTNALSSTGDNQVRGKKKVVQKYLVLKDRVRNIKQFIGLLLILAVRIRGLAYHLDLQMIERNNRERNKETKEPSTKLHMQVLGLNNKVSSINHHIPQNRVSFLRNNLKNEMWKIGRYKTREKKKNCLKFKETVKEKKSFSKLISLLSNFFKFFFFLFYFSIQVQVPNLMLHKILPMQLMYFQVTFPSLSLADDTALSPRIE